MNSEIVAAASFILITTFTPGPNNISSASMGIRFGYQKTMRYLLGIVTGFFFVLLLSGLISNILLTLLPSIEGVLRIFGALYILYLAWHTLKAAYTFDEAEQKWLGFKEGFILQLLNPKAIIYGLTLYSTFISNLVLTPLHRSLSAVLFAMIGFLAISTWTLSGAFIRTHMLEKKMKQGVNIALSLLLVYTAVDLSGVLSALAK